MQRILVTGGAGYIGSTLVPMLLSSYQVTVIDNFMYQQASLNQVCSNKNFNVIKGDVRDTRLMHQQIATADVIIPLAAIVGAPACDRDPVTSTTVNKQAVFDMLDQVSDDQLVIMPTTNSAYGSGDENNYCTESSVLNPISKYAIDKVEVEQRLLEHPSAISYRLATVFGMSPRMRTDLLVNDFVYRAVHDGYVALFEAHFKRNYIHVQDVARAFVFALDNHTSMAGEVYNVGLSNANISKQELCVEIQKQLPNFKILLDEVGKDPDQRNYIVSNQKIESAGFYPTHSLQDGISELVKGYAMISNNKYGNVL